MYVRTMSKEVLEEELEAFVREYNKAYEEKEI
jgi:hypothetical protein